MERQLRINDMDLKYKVSFRDVHYPRLEFKTGSLLLVLPRNYENEEEIIQKHINWIHKKNTAIKNSLEGLNEKNLEMDRTEEDFKSLVHSLVEIFSAELKIGVNRVFFRKMKSKWGSCSPGKNLTINTLLRYLPAGLIEYVIFHEMAHVVEKKHNDNFWKIIAKKCKDYQEYESDLLAYWFLIQRRIDGLSKKETVHFSR
jgi:predicted metal-dependent hydrolase